MTSQADREGMLPTRLKQSRLEAGLTLEKAAEALGTDFNTIWRYEAGRHKPSGPVLYALATLYSKSVEWFFGEDAPADSGAEESPGPEEPDIEADRALIENEASLALRQVAPDLSDHAIQQIAAFIRFTHAQDARERRERGEWEATEDRE